MIKFPQFYLLFVPYLGNTLEPLTQLGFAELKETANNRADIGGTIIGVSIIGQ